VAVDLRQQVEALIAEGRRSIALDLAGITDLDAAGVGELVRVFRMAGAAANARLRVENVTGKAGKLLDLAGLLPLLSASVASRSAARGLRRAPSPESRAVVGLEPSPRAAVVASTRGHEVPSAGGPSLRPITSGAARR
jgi:anti-anti-sigma regulatory factor